MHTVPRLGHGPLVAGPLLARPLAAMLALAVTSAVGGCNRRVFEKVEPSCNTTIVVDVDVPIARAADILIVVDNSGSMAEEQEELARNFVNPLCPIDLSQPIPAAYVNPSPALYSAGGALENCGFIQLVAAFDNDFRVGVVTTDVGIADARFGAEAGWGNRPQRGCLQPDGPPGLGLRKVIARQDLLDGDTANDDLAARFSATLDNIRIYGSPAERGLDAAALFLDPGAQRAGGCEDDLAAFRRADAQLVVLFLTDEEDCSSAYGGGGFVDELALELENDGRPCAVTADCIGGATCSATGICLDPAGVSAGSSRCYTDLDALPGVDTYVSRVLDADPRTKVAIIGGLLRDGAGVAASGCIRRGDDVVDACFESRGFSTTTGAGQPCGSTVSFGAFTGPTREADFARVTGGRGCTLDAAGTTGADCALSCCQADPAGRYLDFARAFVADDGQSNAFFDSICKESYLNTMLQLAAFIASVDFVQLADAPSDPQFIVVEIVRDGQDEPTRVPLIDAAACATEDGFYYEPDRVRLAFCGDARPRPGDALSVRAPGGGVQADGCTLPE